MEPLRVGLVGAGPWATKAYAPMLAAGPETRLACVWARRPEAAAALAAAHASAVVASFDELVARCEAVAFAVPPDVQAELATRAARAGRHLLLDKPLALAPGPARELAEAVEAAGVVTQLMLTHRFRARTGTFLAEARALRPLGARFAFLCGAFLDGPYATPWRQRHGAILDLGPHALDLLEAALGPIASVSGRGDPTRWVSLACHHEGGATSAVSLSGSLRLPRTICRMEVYGAGGAAELDLAANAAEEPWGAARRAFAEAVRRGRSGDLDVHRGVRLQELMERAALSLGD